MCVGASVCVGGGAQLVSITRVQRLWPGDLSQGVQREQVATAVGTQWSPNEKIMHLISPSLSGVPEQFTLYSALGLLCWTRPAGPGFAPGDQESPAHRRSAAIGAAPGADREVGVGSKATLMAFPIQGTGAKGRNVTSGRTGSATWPALVFQGHL